MNDLMNAAVAAILLLFTVVWAIIWIIPYILILGLAKIVDFIVRKPVDVAEKIVGSMGNDQENS